MMRELVQQNIYAFLTPITVLISGLVVSLLFTRLLPPAQFGVFTTLISFTMLFAGISDLGVPNTLVKIAGGSFHSKDGHAGFYVRYLLKWKLAAMIIVSAALLVFSKELAQVFLHDAGFAYVMQAMSVLVILFSISQFVTTLFSSIGRFEYLSVISVILNGSKVLFPILFILLFGSSLSSIIAGVLVAFALAALASLLLFLFRFKEDLSYSAPKSTTKLNSFLFYSTVLVWAGLLSTNVDALMLNYFHGPGELAFFQVSNSVITMLLTLLPFSSTFMLSFLVRMEAKKEKELQKIFFDRSIKYGLLASIPLSFLVYLTANRIIFFFWPQSYIPSAISLRILSLLIPFNLLSGICISLFMSKGRMKELTINTFIFYLFTWSIGLYLIPKYGLVGTALTFVLSAILQAIVLVRLSLKTLGMRINPIHLLKPALASVIITLVILILNPIIKSTILLFVIAGALFCVAYLPLLDADDKKLINTLLSLAKLGSLF